MKMTCHNSSAVCITALANLLIRKQDEVQKKISLEIV